MNPAILAALEPLLNDAISAALSYASGGATASDAQAAFAAAVSRYDAAIVAWQAAEAANPTKG